jgi:hypothetical protein
MSGCQQFGKTDRCVSCCRRRLDKCEEKDPDCIEYSLLFIKEFNKPGNVLISDQFNNRVIEVNSRGEIVWSFGLGPNDFTPNSIIGVNDAERILDGKTLMAGTGTPPNTVPQNVAGQADNRVILVNEHGKIIWQYGKFGQTGLGFDLLNTPVQCTFIPSRDHKKSRLLDGDLMGGTVLITDQGNNRIIEVNEEKKILKTYTAGGTLSSPNSAEKLKDSNVLIADELNNRAIEVNYKDQIVATFTASGTLGACAFASRLCNGNTLLTDAGNNRIVEVNQFDQIVWQYITNSEFQSVASPSPTRGLRLRDGNTIISDQYNNRVIIINETTTILDYYGLPLAGGPALPFAFGNNFGYNVKTTQLGLYSPYDAKVIGDYTGLTKP